MFNKKRDNAIDVSKITEKERVVIKYKATQKPMTEFENLVGNYKGISKGSANNAWQEAKKKLEMNSDQLTILAKTTSIFDKKK